MLIDDDFNDIGFKPTETAIESNNSIQNPNIPMSKESALNRLSEAQNNVVVVGDEDRLKEQALATGSSITQVYMQKIEITYYPNGKKFIKVNMWDSETKQNVGKKRNKKTNKKIKVQEVVEKGSLFDGFVK